MLAKQGIQLAPLLFLLLPLLWRGVRPPLCPQKCRSQLSEFFPFLKVQLQPYRPHDVGVLW